MSNIIQVVGFKNAGKTTLIEYFIKRFIEEEWKVAAIKHDVHGFLMDKSGTDTWKMQQAGADVTAITSPMKTAVLYQNPLSLQELLQHVKDVDVVLVEGFKSENYPKMVLVQQNEIDELEKLQNVFCSVNTESIYKQEMKEKLFNELLHYLIERREEG